MNNTLDTIFGDITQNEEINTYLRFADIKYQSLGRKEHGQSHAAFASYIAGKVLKELGYSARQQRLAQIAAYMHDIGSVINTRDHERSGAMIAFNMLNSLKTAADEADILSIINAIGSHEDKHVMPRNHITAAVILGDKCDVRFERMRGADGATISDKHAKVVAACRGVDLQIFKKARTISLHLDINQEICSVMDYFEIFLSRTLFCQKASLALACEFELYINKDKFL
ncbi:MAG: HD domain-containing protein [Elusimicrobia bacterium]|nr:HD domain-containing protein [Elusimicrobiota bacterium]